MKVREQLKQELPKMTDIMLTTAVNHFSDNFKKQGFDNNGVEKWQPRKRKFYRTRSGKRVDDTTRGILIGKGSGRLSRSLRKRRLTLLSGVITSPLIYARVHNEGGEINRDGGKMLMFYREVATNIQTRKTLKRFASKTGKRKATHAMEVEIGAHKIKMPKRQFVGYSESLNRKIKARLEGRINQIFK